MRYWHAPGSTQCAETPRNSVFKYGECSQCADGADKTRGNQIDFGEKPKPRPITLVWGGGVSAFSSRDFRVWNGKQKNLFTSKPHATTDNSGRLRCRKIRFQTFGTRYPPSRRLFTFSDNTIANGCVYCGPLYSNTPPFVYDTICHWTMSRWRREKIGSIYIDAKT